jgi:hypothetical protein
VRHVRMLGLCLVAALALGAYAVSSASALEWGQCEKLGSNTGLYSGPNCTKTEKASPKGTGEYEWRKASEVAERRVSEGKSANVAFSGETVGSGGVLTTGAMWCGYPGGYGPDFWLRVTREACIASEGEGGHGFVEYNSEEGISVECVRETNTGETEGKNKVANVHVVFTGCLLGGSVPCNSEGAAEEEIVVNTLKGKLGWLNKAGKEVGVMLEPAVKHGLFAEFVCFGGSIHVKVGVGNKKEGSFYLSSGCIGSCEAATPEEEKHGGYDEIISPITPVNTMTSEFTQVYKVDAEHANVPSSFEGKHISLLEDSLVVFPKNEAPNEGKMWSPAGEELTNVNTSEEAGEIKA